MRLRMAGHGGNGAGRHRYAGHGHETGDVPERTVAAEQLVSADAGYGDFQLLFRGRLADEPGIGPVDGRLIHVVEEGWEVGQELLASHDARPLRKGADAG